MPTLSADLELLIDQALANVAELDAALQRSASEFGDRLAESIQAATTDIGAIDGTITITADASGVPAEVDAALADVGSAEVPVTADTTEGLIVVQNFVDTVDAEQAQVSVDADTSEAQSALDDLSSSARSAGDSLEGASGNAGHLGLTTGQLAGAAGLAVGEVGGLREASSLLGERTAFATAGALGLAVGIDKLAQAGFAATSADERFNASLQEQADAVQRVNVGSLSADLVDLGLKFGSAEAATKNATTSVFQFAVNSGASREEATQFADGIAAISARAVATKPSVGDLSDVMERAAIGLGRARTAASLLNIGLSTTEVNTRAAAIAQQRGEESATAYDKSLAALQIAVDRFGPSLKTQIADGAENAANKQKALRAEFDQSLETFAKPLVAPALDLIKAAIPVGQDLAKALEDVASIAIPLLTFALQTLGPAIEPVLVGLITMKAVRLGEGLANDLLLLAGRWGLLGEEAATAAAEVDAAGADAAAGEALATSGLSLIVGAAAAAAVGLGLFGGTTDETAQKVTDFAKALEDANGKLDETGLKAARSLLESRNQIDDLGAAGIKLTDVLAAASNAGRDQEKTLGDLEAVTQKLASANGSNTAAYDVSGHSLAELKTKQQAYIDQIAKEGNPALAQELQLLLNQRDTNAGVVGTIRDLATAHSDVTAKLKERTKAGAADKQITEEQAAASDTAAKAQQAFRDELAQAHATFDDSAAASLRYAAGLQGATDTTKALQTAGTELQNELDLLLGRFLSADQASNAFKLGVIGLEQTLFKNAFAFDANTEAGLNDRNALDDLATKAEAASTAILHQTGSVDAAKQPLVDLLTQVGNLRDNLASKGEDTSFLDALQANVLRAIAGVDAQQPAAKQAGANLSSAGAQGVTSGTPEWLTAGQTNADAAGTGVLSAQGRHAAAALGLSATGTTAFLSAIGAWSTVGAQSANAAGDAVEGQGPVIFTHGSSAGGQGAEGFKAGIAPLPDHAGAAVGDAGGKITDAASSLSGQNGAAFVAGLDVGSSFDAGIAAGIDTFLFEIEIAAVRAVGAAETAARNAARSHSPSELFAELGRDLALGLAGGMTSQEAVVAKAGSALVDQAAAGARVTVPAVPTGQNAPAPATASPGVGNGASGVAGGALIGQQVNNFNVPVVDPHQVARETAQANRVAMFLAGVN